MIAVAEKEETRPSDEATHHMVHAAGLAPRSRDRDADEPNSGTNIAVFATRSTARSDPFGGARGGDDRHGRDGLQPRAARKRGRALESLRVEIFAAQIWAQIPAGFVAPPSLRRSRRDRYGPSVNQTQIKHGVGTANDLDSAS